MEFWGDCYFVVYLNKNFEIFEGSIDYKLSKEQLKEILTPADYEYHMERIRRK